MVCIFPLVKSIGYWLNNLLKILSEFVLSKLYVWKSELIITNLTLQKIDCKYLIKFNKLFLNIFN